ncbi:MAG: hypothetical protein H6825_11210 [Planctomycetes bacterium]|nr:hypothetical protein [Planctomycetota bacterium]
MADAEHDGPLSLLSLSGATWLATCAAAGSIFLSGCAAPRSTTLAAGSTTTWPPVVSDDAAIAASDEPGASLDASSSTIDEAAAETSGEPATGAAAEAPESKVKGNVSLRARRRWTGDSRDLDLYGLLSVDVGDESKDDVTAHVLGRVAWDVDGRNGDDSGTFSSIDDSYDSRLTERLYDAWIDVHRVGPFKTMRVGRQTLWETPELVVFDGGRVDTEEFGPLRISGGAYAGQTSHEFESSPRQDAVYGVFAQTRPWQGSRVRLDAMHLRDDTSDAGKLRNDFVGMNVWQSVGENLRLHGEYTRLENHSRDAQVDGTWYDAENDFMAQLSYKEFLQPQARRVTELDPYFTVLGEYAPYHQSRMLLSKGFDDDFTVEAGTDVRRLADGSDEGPFNREFQRWFATGTIHYPEQLDVSVTGEVWDGDGEGTSTWGLDATKQATDALRVSAGSYYSLFKSDYLLDSEREHVRTYYLRIKQQLDPASTFSLGYEYEDADFQNLQTLTAKMTWRF